MSSECKCLCLALTQSSICTTCESWPSFPYRIRFRQRQLFDGTVFGHARRINAEPMSFSHATSCASRPWFHIHQSVEHLHVEPVPPLSTLTPNSVPKSSKMASRVSTTKPIAAQEEPWRPIGPSATCNACWRSTPNRPALRARFRHHWKTRSAPGHPQVVNGPLRVGLLPRSATCRCSTCIRGLRPKSPPRAWRESGELQIQTTRLKTKLLR